MRRLSSKLPGVGTTIFTVMSQLAEDCDAINLSQGFPDFQPPAALLDRVSHHLRAGHNQYPPMTGVVGLREQISAKVERLYAVRPDPTTEVTVASGATEALFCAIHAIVHSGEEVVVFDPAYDSMTRRSAWRVGARFTSPCLRRPLVSTGIACATA